MKRLKILIIIENETFYLPAIKLVSEIVSSLKQSAQFFYAKGFEEALSPEKEQPMVNGVYDVIFLFAHENKTPLFSVLDSLAIASESSLPFFISTSYNFVKKIKEDDIIWPYIMDEEGRVSLEDFGKMKTLMLL